MEDTLKETIFSHSDAEITHQIGRFIELNRRLQGESKLGMSRRMHITPNTYERLIVGHCKLITLTAGLRVLSLSEPLETFFQQPKRSHQVAAQPKDIKPDDTEENLEW